MSDTPAPAHLLGIWPIALAAITYVAKQVSDFTFKRISEYRERHHLNRFLATIFETSLEDYNRAYEFTDWDKIIDNIKQDANYVPHATAIAPLVKDVFDEVKSELRYLPSDIIQTSTRFYAEEQYISDELCRLTNRGVFGGLSQGQKEFSIQQLKTQFETTINAAECACDALRKYNERSFFDRCMHLSGIGNKPD